MARVPEVIHGFVQFTATDATTTTEVMLLPRNARLIMVTLGKVSAATPPVVAAINLHESEGKPYGDLKTGWVRPGGEGALVWTGEVWTGDRTPTLQIAATPNVGSDQEMSVTYQVVVP